MMFNLSYLIIPALSYLIGSFPTALFFNKAVNKIDPRKTGSKNLGALNTLRITAKQKGKLKGILAFLCVFLIDALKGVACVAIAMNFIPENTLLAAVLASSFAILGHNYSILLKFEGGRGAATFLGILFFLDWKMFFLWLISIAIFAFIFELIVPISNTGNFFKRALSDQIIGRLTGEIVALIPFYFLNPFVFWVALPSVFLIIVKHIDRIKNQLDNYGQ